MIKSGDLVRWNTDVGVFIKRVKSVKNGIIYYFDRNNSDSCIGVEQADDALLHAGERVKMLDTGIEKIVSEVFVDGFGTEDGCHYDFENYDGYLTFNVVDNSKDNGDDEVFDLDDKLLGIGRRRL